MPQVSPDTPSVTRKFYDMSFTVPMPFKAGDTMDANLARFVNNQLATTVGNRFGAKVRAALEEYNEGKKAADRIADASALPGVDWQAVFADTFASYEPGTQAARGEGKASGVDPVASLIRFLAKAAITAKIKAKGLKVKDFMDAKVTGDDGTETSKFLALVAQYEAANHDALKAQAEAQLGSVAADDDDLTLSTEAPTAEAA